MLYLPMQWPIIVLTMIPQIVYLAVSCAFSGMVITFAVLLVCQYFGVNIDRHLWIIAIPVFLSLLLNVILLELYRKYQRDHRKR